MVTPITIPIEEDAAAIYNAATEEQRENIQMLLTLLVRQLGSPTQSLSLLMDDISREAEARGLTDDILEDLLCDES